MYVIYTSYIITESVVLESPTLIISEEFRKRLQRAMTMLRKFPQTSLPRPKIREIEASLLRIQLRLLVGSARTLDGFLHI